MREEIEFHDSKIRSMAQEGASIKIEMDVYVHRWEKVAGKWAGTGRAQPIVISIANGACAKQPALPARLDGGDIRVGEALYNYLVPLPFAATGPVVLRFELVDSEDL